MQHAGGGRVAEVTINSASWTSLDVIRWGPSALDRCLSLHSVTVELILSPGTVLRQMLLRPSTTAM